MSYTYQDYLAIPEDTSRRHEIVDGPPDLVGEDRFEVPLEEVFRG